MNKEMIENEIREIKELVSTKIIPDFQKFHLENIAFISNNKNVYEDWKSNLIKLSSRSKIFNSSAEMFDKLEKNTHKQSAIFANEVIFKLYDLLETYLIEKFDHFDQQFILKQEAYHFEPIEGDSNPLRIFKKTKIFSFKFIKVITTPFRKKDIEYSWKRKVPLKNLASHYFIHNVLNKSLKVFEGYVESAGSSFITVLNEQKIIDTHFTNKHLNYLKEKEEVEFEEVFTNYISKISDTKSALDNEFANAVNSLNSLIPEVYDEFRKDFAVVGTLELPERKYNSRKIKNQFSNQKKKLDRSKKHYKNFFSAIFDRVEFYQDLLWFNSLLISNTQNIKKYTNSFFEKTVTPIIKKIIDEIENSISRIETNEEISNQIENEKTVLKEVFDLNLVPALINKVSENNVSNVLIDYSKSLEKNLDEFDKEYTFIKPKNLIYRVDADQLKEFSPKDIISPIVLKKVSNVTEKISGGFTNDISKQNTAIIGLGRIIEYNLESALIKLREDGAERKDAVDIATEGLSRAINKAEDYSEQLELNINKVLDGVEEEVKDVLHYLMSLSNIDRLITIKIRVSKEKAIQEAKKTFQNYYSRTSEWFLIFKTHLLNLFTQSKEKIAGISSKVGLSSTQIELSEAMADYLVRVSESLKKLPYVYQRLFSNDPLTDERIFIGREEEIGRLNKAINYWLNNQIASVMLIGEKGSGTSSLLNIALNKFELNEKLYRKEFSGTIYTEKELLKSLIELLKLEGVDSVEKLIEKMNGFEERKIIIIENIEDFFLRIIGGFEAITTLLEIITATNNNILWITTCNIYSWKYLQNVLNINDYFIFNIHLMEVNEELIDKIIISRHNISGYDFEFIPSNETVKQKSFSKLTDIEKQGFLRKKYFDQLKKLSSNNISVALFIWLRSIVEVDEENIKVNSDIDLDYSFLKSLSDQKLFSLMAIILHDGLTLEQHSLIFNISIKASQLLFASLSDDGIIFHRQNTFKVNFQLYNPIANLLKDKNILH